MFRTVRADPDTAARLLADASQAALHAPHGPHGEYPVRGNLEFVHPSVFLDQLGGYREQLDNIGRLGLHTVSNQPRVTVRIRVDVPVSKLFQIGMGQPAEAHEDEHVPDGLLALVTQLDTDNALQVLLREERAFLVFRLAYELLEQVLVNPSLVHGQVHQPFQCVDTLEGR
jgi:hypothetical protein